MDPIRLLVSDLDGTLLGDDDALSAFRSWIKATRSDWRLAYATGRTLASVEGLIADGVLPRPDAVIANVGTEIYGPDGRTWPGWPTWDPDWDAAVARSLLAAVPGIDLQADANQTDWKASFHAPGLDASAVDDIRAALVDADIDATVIYSSAQDLDVMPPGSGKAAATRHLARDWKLDPDDVLAAGDSGNDLDLLTAGFRAIVVANAQPELRDLSHPLVFHARRPYAAGVLDGIEHWTGSTANVDVTGEPGQRDTA
jgi:sucrose-6F-phosphate phosphohydrolase